MSAPLQPAADLAVDLAANSPWIEPPPVHKERRRMQVIVRTETGQRHEYEGLYSDSFAAYDDALVRFALANRIEVRPVATGGRHAQ